jgi:hypothetical protein
MADVLAEWLSKKGVKQCHIAGVLISFFRLLSSMFSLVVNAGLIGFVRNREVRARNLLLQRWR